MAQLAGLDELEVAVADWADVLADFMPRWDQGQHVIMFGRTGRGKTTLGHVLCEEACELRGASACMFGTKARDRTLRATGWPIIRTWPPTYHQRVGKRIVYWPPYSKPSTARERNRSKIMAAFDEIMLEGGWRLFVDEMAYLVQTLGLRTVLDEFWNGARSSEISLVAASQRPAWVSRSGVSQAEWNITFAVADEDDRKRVAEIFGDRRRFNDAIQHLGEHDFLMVESLTQRAVISCLPGGDHRGRLDKGRELWVPPERTVVAYGDQGWQSVA